MENEVSVSATEGGNKQIKRTKGSNRRTGTKLSDKEKNNKNGETKKENEEINKTTERLKTEDELEKTDKDFINIKQLKLGRSVRWSRGNRKVHFR